VPEHFPQDLRNWGVDSPGWPGFPPLLLQQLDFQHALQTQQEVMQEQARLEVAALLHPRFDQQSDDGYSLADLVDLRVCAV